MTDPSTILGLQSATAAAADWLRSAILSGQFRPGDRLVELRLAKTLGVGQPTIREALKDLEVQGFVRKLPKRGTYVTDLKGRDLSEILETRVALEEVAVRRATLTATSADLEHLSLLQKRLVQAAETLDRTGFHDSDMQFHRMIWRLADNSFLSRTLETVAFAPFAFYVTKFKPEIKEIIVASAVLHRPIVEGMESGDPDRAGDAYRTSTLEFWKTWQKVEILKPRPERDRREAAAG